MYNRNALNRIATRDQLDRAIVLISPSLWISIIGALLIIAGLCVWGFQGKLPTSIDTSGIYLDELKRIKDLDTRIGYVEDITFEIRKRWLRSSWKQRTGISYTGCRICYCRRSCCIYGSSGSFGSGGSSRCGVCWCRACSNWCYRDSCILMHGRQVF